MARRKAVFVCQTCGFQSSKWLGKCSDCGGWNTLVEELQSARAGSAGSQAPRTAPIPMRDIPTEQRTSRIPSGSAELDRVLGGGIFPASVVLVAGEPGIGKSTLMLQTMLNLHRQKRPALYISGEESLQQIRNRADRLPGGNSELLVLAETDISVIEYHLAERQPEVVVVDSIQAIYNPELSGAPGNVSQVRECAARLFRLAKERGFSLFLIGHVTKDGSVAGPKILEHLVDVVVNFESNTLQHRIVRSVKNRFGAAHELGVYEMSATGLLEVSDTSGLFLNPDQRPASGSSIVCSFEGSRPLLIEVQALVSRSNYGTPQRTVSGFDQRRLSLILAILEKYCQLDFGYHDVFVKVAGGLRIEDPGIDLGIAAALYSSRQEEGLEADAVYVGELGLGGEVRPVSFAVQRLQECRKMGFRQVYLPTPNLPDAQQRRDIKLLLSPVKSVSELLLPAG